MAVDTRAKRLSMLNMGHGSLLPDPNTSGVDASERATFMLLYGGIALDAPLPVRVFAVDRRVLLAQGQANQKVPVTLVDATDALVAETGVTAPTVEWSFNGAAYAAPSDGTWTEVGYGDYTVTLDDIDTGELGWGLLRVVKDSVTAETKVLVEISTSPTERRSDYIRTRSQQRTRR